MTPELVNLLLNRPRGVAMLETLEISHSSFIQTYYIVRNFVPGGSIDVTLETAETVTAQYVPCTIQWAKSKTDMDQRHKITIQDLNEIIRPEEIAVSLDSDEPISCKLRAYLSTDLTAPADGPYLLEIDEIAYSIKGASFTAKAPNTNASGTGERYTVARFPSLRGFMLS